MALTISTNCPEMSNVEIEDSNDKLDKESGGDTRTVTPPSESNENVLTVSTIGLGTPADNFTQLEDKDSEDKIERKSTRTTQTATALSSPDHKVITVSTIGLETASHNLSQLEDKDSNDKMENESTGTTQTASRLSSPGHKGDRNEPNLNVPSDYNNNVITVSTIGLETASHNLSQLEDKDSNEKMENESTGTTQTASRLSSPNHKGDRNEPNLNVPSDYNNNVITVYSTGLEESSATDHHLQVSSESSEKGIVSKYISKPGAITMTIGGLISLLALATGLSPMANGRGTPDSPVLSDVLAERSGLTQITNHALGLKASHSDFIRTHATAGYLEATIAESGTETPRETGFSPAAIAMTICGIVSFLALAIGISAMVVRRRRKRKFDFNVSVKGDESVSNNSLNA